MAAEKGKKLKVAEKGDADSAEHLDAELLQSIEKLQEIQDELEKVRISFQSRCIVFVRIRCFLGCLLALFVALSEILSNLFSGLLEL